jgi:hypothetical protein
MQFALLVPDLPHPYESSAYYESLLSLGPHATKRRHVFAACVRGVSRWVRWLREVCRPTRRQRER